MKTISIILKLQGKKKRKRERKGSKRRQYCKIYYFFMSTKGARETISIE